MTQKLAKLNKKETEFFTKAFDFYNEEKMQELLKEEALYKTFLNELKKVERKNGYEPHKANVTNMITYFGEYRFESIEYYVCCYKDDLKLGAERYFENYY
jgi:hypothetical protein